MRYLCIKENTIKERSTHAGDIIVNIVHYPGFSKTKYNMGDISIETILESMFDKYYEPEYRNMYSDLMWSILVRSKFIILQGIDISCS